MPDRKTAVRMAQKKARLFGGTPTLITYELDEAFLQSDIKIKRFPETATVEWFLFVDANRDRKNDKPIHDYDIVIGPIANYLTDYALSELVKYVMEDTGCSIEEAMERVYNSPLMTALQDEEGELYVQSPAYLYELMKEQAVEEIEGL